MSSLLKGFGPNGLVVADPLGSDKKRGLVEAERLRLARELLDINGYGFAKISLEAGVAAHLAAQRPEQAVAALDAIRTASGEVLDEMRAMLGRLRRS
jgi:signal transduction histidine kinase